MRTPAQIARGMLGLASDQDLQYAEIFGKLPSFESIKDKKIAGVTNEERFKRFCEKAEGSLMHFVGDDAVDEIFREEAYVRFIIQLSAQLKASGQLNILGENVLPEIDLEQWSQISEVFGDSGVNASFSGVIAKRRHGDDAKFDLYGAFAGGLGNKLSKATYDAMEERLKDGQLDQATRSAIEEKLSWADNVVLDDKGQRVYVPYAGASQARAKEVEILTVGRESLEELGELIIAQYKLDKRGRNFVDVMSEAFGGVTSAKGREIFRRMGEIVDGPNYNEKTYKGAVEPLFREFIKTTPEGKNIVAELTACLVGETVVTDRTFPKGQLDNGNGIAADAIKFDNYLPGGQDISEVLADDSAAEDKKVKTKKIAAAPAILVPKSVCYIVDDSKLRERFGDKSALLALKQSALQASRAIFGAEQHKDRKQLKADNILFEAKGFKEETKFKDLIKLFCDSPKDKKPSFVYLHENLAAIKAVIKDMSAEQVTHAQAYLEGFREGNPKFDEKLKVVLEYKARSPRDHAQPQNIDDVFKNFFEEPLAKRAQELAELQEHKAISAEAVMSVSVQSRVKDIEAKGSAVPGAKPATRGASAKSATSSRGRVEREPYDMKIQNLFDQVKDQIPVNGSRS